MSAELDDYCLTIRAQNRPGLVSAVAGSLAGHGGDITDAQQFDDQAEGRFFMRCVFRMADIESFRNEFAQIAKDLDLETTLRTTGKRRKVLILLSKFDHCAADLLYRMRIGELNMECVGLVSNHPSSTLKITGHQGLPFWHLPITPQTKPEQEAGIKRVIEETDAELIVLARYMQILSDDLAGFLAGRCINIHHSFLPGFKGAKPYHQAYSRGVKMIGATAHYVTADLDEGPIIAQDVEQASHKDTPEDLVRRGRDIERRVLSRAVALHLEDRVIIHGSKTVVFQ